MAPPRPPSGSGRVARAPAPARPRRGPPERPINARTVRGTWLLVALPLLLAAFTVGRPQPLPPPTLPAAFDGETAATLAAELARDYPDRSPGTAGALGAAQWFRNQLRLYGFEAEAEPFRAEIPGRGRVELRNLVAVAQGPSARAIVFLAHRDNTGFGAGANDNASGTAALIELARAYAPVPGVAGVQARPAHTLVFVSTDGGAYGSLGAAHFAESSPYAENPLAVVSLDALGGGAPRLVFDGDTPRSPAASFVRTAAERILEETGREPDRSSALRQLLDLGFPFTLGEQGPLVARGVPALTLTTVADGALPADEEAPIRPASLAELGRAAQSLLGSLDAGLELTRGTTSYVYLDRRIVLGWALQLVLIASLLPFAIGAVDLFARCRRRRIPLLPALRSLRSRLGFWAYVGVLVLLATSLGLFPDGVDGRPLPPHAPGVGEPPVIGVALLVALGLGGWLAGRDRLIPRRPATAPETLGGYSVALLALGVVALLVVATNPYALLYLLPSLYAWLWLPQAYDGPGVVRGVLLAAGFTGPLLLVVSFAERQELGLEAPWYLLSLVATGYVPWLAVVIALAWLAAASQLAALAGGRYAAYPDRRDRPAAGPFRSLARRGDAAWRGHRAPGEERDAAES
jgi:hypothetical protein